MFIITDSLCIYIYKRSENVQFSMGVAQGIRVVFTIKGGS